MSKFNIGDRVISGKDVGNIIFLFEDRAVVSWDRLNRKTNAPALCILKHYQEPLKYGSGEEVKVGDIIYGDIAHKTAQVLLINGRTISVIIFKTGSRHVWKNFSMMSLWLRLGELYDG